MSPLRATTASASFSSEIGTPNLLRVRAPANTINRCNSAGGKTRHARRPHGRSGSNLEELTVSTPRPRAHNCNGDMYAFGGKADIGRTRHSQHAGRGWTWSVRGHVRWPVTRAADRFRPSTFTSARWYVSQANRCQYRCSTYRCKRDDRTERPMIGFPAGFPARPVQVLGRRVPFCGRHCATATVKKANDLP